MKVIIVSIMTLAGLMCTTSSALAVDDAVALLKKSNCMGCHKMEGKLVGPGFAEVAKKYKGDASAVEKLNAKVNKGGAGVWGTMPMPAMNNVKPDDIKIMINYILTQGK